LHFGYKIPVEENVEGPDPVRDGAGGACVGGFVGGRRDGAPPCKSSHQGSVFDWGWLSPPGPGLGNAKGGGGIM